MKVSRIRALRGPNLWSRHTALEAIIACTEAERSIDTLRAHAAAYPVDAEVVAVLIGCQRQLIVDADACGTELVERFGTDVLAQMGRMQEAGAFGRPAGPDGQPLR